MTVTSNTQGLPARWQDKTLQKQVLGALGLLTGLGAGLASYAVLREPFQVILEEVTLRIPQAKGRLPSAGLRILHLSDTHFQGIDWREQAKINSIRRLTAKLSYDLLVHTGDFWHNETGLENIALLLKQLPPPRLGSYGVFGNHDYVCYSHSDLFSRSWGRYRLRNGNDHHLQRHHRLLAFYENARELYRFAHYFMNMPFDLKRIHFNDVAQLRQTLNEHQMQILHNQSLHLRHKPGQSDGVDLYLAGLDDVAEGTPDLQQTLRDIDRAAPNILLSHNPDVLEDPASRRANVILAGHTHGGQIVLPWLGAAHTHSEHLRRHEASGLLWRDQTQVYVSRGIGEGIPLRFRASPQIALITLLPGE
ncbi:MAG: metallophosphoesterase [Caldilineaceae bacterium]|nr:metallophosphoesterase [Caldilineaceae bacterium]